MHGKEKILAPILEKDLGVRCELLMGIDTDQFGTFTGEVERSRSIIDTARAKCDHAHARSGCDLVLASEGTFGPHPHFSFVSSDHEFLLLKDYHHDLEITGSVLSLQTNFDRKDISSFADLVDFARTAGLPTHGIILSTADRSRIFKGITDIVRLKSCFEELLPLGQPITAETDMRAHFNPTRQTVIAEAAADLIVRATSLCPSCQLPGFVVERIKAGLPCEQCGTPTSSPLKYLRVCPKCGYSAEEMYPEGKRVEEAGKCGECNP